MSRGKRKIVSYEDFAYCVSDATKNTANEAIERIEYQDIKRWLGCNLTKDELLLLGYIYGEQYTLKEVTETYGCGYSCLKMRHKRILDKIRQHYKQL